MFHRLILNSGKCALRAFYPKPNGLTQLATLGDQPGYISLTAPMTGYGLSLEPGADETAGTFHVWLERQGTPSPYSTCWYCSGAAEAPAQVAAVIEACQAVGLTRRVHALPSQLQQVQDLPWLAVLRWKAALAPPEAPVLEDAVLTALVAGPRLTVYSSRGLPAVP